MIAAVIAFVLAAALVFYARIKGEEKKMAGEKPGDEKPGDEGSALDPPAQAPEDNQDNQQDEADESEDETPPAQTEDKLSEQEEKTAQEAVETDEISFLKAGDALKLERVKLFVSSGAKSDSGSLSGTYYVWSDEVVAKRIRVTNKPQNVGKSGQVTGWINISAVLTEKDEEKEGEQGATEPQPGSRAAFLKLATSQIGYSTSKSKVNKYTKWYCGDSAPHEWCGMFVVWCARYSGVGASVIPKSAYIPYFYSWFKGRKLNVKGTSSQVAPGDLVIYDWNGNNASDHIGIIYKLTDDYLYAIEGNKDPKKVVVRKIKRSSGYVQVVAKPKFLGE